MDLVQQENNIIMQKIRTKQKWDSSSKRFENNNSYIRETDKIITGLASINSKDNDKWISKDLPFIAFKSKIDIETQKAILDSRGNIFEADFNLACYTKRNKEGQELKNEKGYEITDFRIIINQARFEAIDKHNQAKANGYQPQEELLDDDIPF